MYQDLDSLFRTPQPLLTFYYAEEEPKITTCGGTTKKGCQGKKCIVRRQFPVDLKETMISYMVYADLPGYAKEQIHLDFDEGERTLHISARKKTAPMETEQMDDAISVKSSGSTHSSSAQQSASAERWIRRERPDGSGECERIIELPKDAVADAANASFVDGVLIVTIPRQPPKKHSIAFA